MYLFILPVCDLKNTAAWLECLKGQLWLGNSFCLLYPETERCIQQTLLLQEVLQPVRTEAYPEYLGLTPESPGRSWRSWAADENILLDLLWQKTSGGVTVALIESPVVAFRMFRKVFSAVCLDKGLEEVALIHPILSPLPTGQAYFIDLLRCWYESVG